MFYNQQREVPIIKLSTDLEPIIDFNFLGIIINKHVKWNNHLYINLRRSSDGAFIQVMVRSFVRSCAIQSDLASFYAICPHSARTNGILCRLKHFLAPGVLVNIYNCLILPNLYDGPLVLRYERTPLPLPLPSPPLPLLSLPLPSPPLPSPPRPLIR